MYLCPRRSFRSWAGGFHEDLFVPQIGSKRLLGRFNKEQNFLIFLCKLRWIMERTVDEAESLVQFKNTLQAAIKEVQVDVRAFKEQIVQKMEELSDSSRPLAGVVSRLQEENRQLRAKLEALSCLVEGLTGVKVDQGTTGGNVKNMENGQMQSQEVVPCAGLKTSQSTSVDHPGPSGGSNASVGTGPSNTSVPPPWRTRRQAEVNVSTLFTKEAN